LAGQAHTNFEEHKLDEQELTTKYKNAGIVKGSLRPGKGDRKGKNVVDCKCKKCGFVNKDVATSDLWLRYCRNPKCLEKLSQSPTRGRKAATKKAK
jgi:hypothetical protein